MLDISKIQAEVARAKTDDDAIIGVLGEVKAGYDVLIARVADLQAQIAALGDPTVQASVDQLASDLKAENDKIEAVLPPAAPAPAA